LLNPFYYLLRLAAGAVAAMRGKGEVGRYPSKSAVALALLKADFAAMRMLPRMLAKRKRLVRRLSTSDIYCVAQEVPHSAP